MHDIQALCKRVFVIHKGSSLYDGDFEDLVNKVNPKRKLIFQFSDNINIIDGTIINAELPDSELTKLVYDLFKIAPPISITMENLPVEDTMRTFFSEPEKFLK